MTADSLPGALAGLGRGKAPPGSQRATVTAVRWDGMVNARDTWGGLHLGIPALDTYIGRAVGDQVLIADVSGSPYVIGRVAGDPTLASPLADAHVSAVYLADGTLTGGIDQAQQGASGVPGDTEPLRTGWFYGATLSTACASAGNAWLWLCRNPRLHGAYGPQQVRLWLHASTGPPASGFAELTAYGAVVLTLEVGEVRIVHLPAAWVTALGAGTARGFGVGALADAQVSYIRYVAPSGGFTTAA